MYSLSIPNLLAVSAPSTKELETLIARALALREEHAETLQSARYSVATGAPMSAQGGGSQTPNVDKWEAKHGKRLRMTGEESAEFGKGEPARESAAMQRLANEGDTLAEGGAMFAPMAQGATLGATVAEGAELDPEELV